MECSGSAGSGLKVWSQGRNRHRWQCLQNSKTVYTALQVGVSSSVLITMPACRYCSCTPVQPEKNAAGSYRKALTLKQAVRGPREHVIHLIAHAA